MLTATDRSTHNERQPGNRFAMISNTLSAPADACGPAANRDGPAMPPNIARLLCILRILLDFGRRLAAGVERVAATRDFWLFSAVFGTTTLPVIHTHIHRGILRAATLESLLLQRAAAGRDMAARPLHPNPAPTEDTNADPCNEPFDAQVARLTAERARHDAQVDPDNPATAEQIEAEVRARPIGRTIADIRRDLGIIAIMCTREFWDTVTDAVAAYQDSAAEYLDATQPAPECPQQKHAAKPPTNQMDRGPDPYPQRTNRPRRTPGSKIVERPLDRFGTMPAPAKPRPKSRLSVPEPNRHATVAGRATGPPLRAATKCAA
jgi:hypothetical protein